MTKFGWTIVTKENIEREHVRLLCANIEKVLELTNSPLISPYPKFIGSWKIEFYTGCLVNKDAVHRLLHQASLIASPWLAYYDEDNLSVELILNADKNCRFTSSDFESILWANSLFL